MADQVAKHHEGAIEKQRSDEFKLCEACSQISYHELLHTQVPNFRGTFSADKFAPLECSSRALLYDALTRAKAAQYQARQPEERDLLRGGTYDLDMYRFSQAPLHILPPTRVVDGILLLFWIRSDGFVGSVSYNVLDSAELPDVGTSMSPYGALSLSRSTREGYSTGSIFAIHIISPPHRIEKPILSSL